MVSNVEKHLTRNRYAAGSRFTAADTQLAAGIQFTMDILKVLPERPVFRDYVARLSERPAFKRYQERDQAMAMATPFFQEQFGGKGD